MKTNKAVKILTIILTILMLVMTTTSVFAADGDKGGEINLTPNQVQAKATAASDDMQTFGGKILGVLTTAGIILSVVILVVLGIKYMLGSAEEKAEYKKTLMPYMIGAVLIFGASTIANIAYNFLK